MKFRRLRNQKSHKGANLRGVSIWKHPAMKTRVQAGWWLEVGFSLRRSALAEKTVGGAWDNVKRLLGAKVLVCRYDPRG